VTYHWLGEWGRAGELFVACSHWLRAAKEQQGACCPANCLGGLGGAIVHHPYYKHMVVLVEWIRDYLRSALSHLPLGCTIPKYGVVRPYGMDGLVGSWAGLPTTCCFLLWRRC
jgi:hypothetical protein